MIRTKPPSDLYCDGWDRVFGEAEPPDESLPIAMPAHPDNTGAPCRNGGKRVPIENLDHDACYTCSDIYEDEAAPA